jgi:pilus assembly protein Flp/PilA
MNTVFSALYTRVIRPIKARLRLEDGLEAVEYALIAALLAVVIIGAMSVFGDGLNGIFSDIAARLGTEGQAINEAPE